jgi:uncharacterized CHY-type Zn-finger protein
MEKKLLFGVGYNDVGYSVYKSRMVDGKQINIWVCPYYQKWVKVLERCYSLEFHKRNPRYVGCYVCDDWLTFSNFIRWVDSQPNKNWINCEPDKDLLIVGNKIYSEDTCVFVTRQVNQFTKDSAGKRGSYMIGVKINKEGNKYISDCSDPFLCKQEYLGRFKTELEAHKAWQAKKHEHACQLADLQEDPRVAKALRERYAPDKDWTKA